MLWTICDDRDKTINEWFEGQLRKLSNPPFRAVIHKATAFKKARGHGLSIFDYRDKFPRVAGARSGATDFEGLTEEVRAYECERRNTRERGPAVNAG